MIKTIINTKYINQAEVVILSAPYEKTASSHKGTVNGPKAVVKSLNFLLEFFNSKFKKNVSDYLKIAHIDLAKIKTLSPDKTFKIIKEESQKILSKDKFVFLLGGEHSVCIGLFESLAQKYNPKEVTILQIDAHCDLRNDDSDYSENPSPFAHSTVMRRASEIGYNIIQIGIRTYSEEEYLFFKDPKNKVKVFEWGLNKPTVQEIVKNIKTKYLYITIDVDGFDPAHMPGTGTPVQGGLEWWYGIDLLEKSIAKAELIGADIVEVSPVKDSVLTEYGSAELLYRILANKYQKRFLKK